MEVLWNALRWLMDNNTYVYVRWPKSYIEGWLTKYGDCYAVTGMLVDPTRVIEIKISTGEVEIVMYGEMRKIG